MRLQLYCEVYPIPSRAWSRSRVLWFDVKAGAARIDLIHALFAGLSILDLATGRRNAEKRAKAVLQLAFEALEGEPKEVVKLPASKPSRKGDLL